MEKNKTGKYRLKAIKNITALCFMMVLCLSGIWSCARKAGTKGKQESSEKLTLKYATQFDVSYYDGGYKLIHIADGSDYVIVPDGKKDDDLGITDAVIIHEKPENIYLAASSAMDLFVALDSTENIKTCSTTADDYTIEEATEKIKNGDIIYVGKYRSPDYETILDTGCDLAIESTMITHAPETKEELERLGIPVLTERSSYEKDPLGRLEWIKLYGVLLGKEKEAESFFVREEEKVNALTQELEQTQTQAKEQKKVAFFYVSSNGYINVRKPGDYVSSMIEMAGGIYAYRDIADESDNALSTMNINWEEFYRCTVDADILIYNATVDGGVRNIQELLDKNELFAEFKAVREGNVYCSNADLFQRTSLVADIITDMYGIINSGDAKDLKFMYKLER